MPVPVVDDNRTNRQILVRTLAGCGMQPTEVGDGASALAVLRLAARHALRESRRSARLLLAEDNPVNQMVALRMLQKHGHAVRAVGNGREALLAIEREPFDVLLMDVQMPELDGYEATAILRAREQTTGTHLAIIALTAHAMKGDRERCLAAGMDAYVSKPIDFEALQRTIESPLPPAEGESGQPPAPARSDAGPPTAILDLETARARVEGDLDLMGQLVQAYRAETPACLDRIGDAVSRGDLSVIERGAHRLKGSLATLGADRGAAAAQRLVEAARRQDGAGARDAWAVLRSELNTLEPRLDSLLAREPETVGKRAA